MNSDHPSGLLQLAERGGYYSVLQTELGELYKGDCLLLLRNLPDACVDMVFADPPFNLGKDYGREVSDSLKRDEYLVWSKAWLDECIRVLYG